MQGKQPLLFIDIGVKIDHHYYNKYVLQDNRLQYDQNLYGNDYLYFQQDFAPSRKATRTQDRPDSSPDLNLRLHFEQN
jgi:hypothetical protein